MADNTSATGGYLQAVAAPDEGRDLTDILRGMFAGITGITTPGYIRALWQAVPPTVPEPNQTWLAFGIQAVLVDGLSPYIGPEIIVDGNNVTEQVRQTQQETTEIIVQVYGLRCMAYAHAIRDGLNIAQNREALSAEGIAYVGCSDVRRVPEQVDTRWYDRADITLTFRRQAERTYRVLSFVQAVGEINEQEFETEIPS